MKVSASGTPAKQLGAKSFGLKRITILFAATLTGVLALLILSAAFLVHNRDFLLDHAEQVWGRKISAGRIEITFLPLGMRLVDLRVADNPAFSAEDFLSAKQARLEIRLLPLFIGQIHPETIVLDSPSITIICNADGRYNFASRARDRKTSGRADVRSGSAESSDSQERWLLSAPSIEIFNGAVRYRDLREVNELTATGIDLSLEDFGWEKPFDIRLEAAVMAEQPNLRFKSRIGPIAANSDYRDVPLAGELNAVNFDFGKINRSVPRLRKALPRALRFDGIYTIHDLKFSGTLNRLSLKGAVTGTDASFRFE